MTEIRDIEYLVGSKKIRNKTITPYNNIICNFLSDLSKELNLSEESKVYPDIKTLAFWCRKKNIEKFKNQFKSNESRLGLGLLFHITPSNIPTNFAYSLVFGLVTGNSNVIKVPSQNFEQVKIICNTINKILKKYKTLQDMITIVRYKNHNFFTNKFSLLCSARLIWGGDNTIKEIQKYSSDQRSIDITFSDRYSFCTINSEKFLSLKKDGIKTLAEKFYNDTYLVDQNGCSSPHLVVWIGKKYKKARVKFWSSLKEVVEKKYELSESASFDKYTQLFKDILSLKNISNYEMYGSQIYTVLLKKLDKDNHKLRGKWGFFYEYNTNDINKIKSFINPRYQTLTYFGLEKNTLSKFVLSNKLRGIDRVVPIGQALDMNFFWDGYDINKILTRVVEIR
tara:strand:- start:203 stop:1387 length:1185 start_codon:yes stop_codon:yes gene_type:complete